MKGAYVTHNHPIGSDGDYSFSNKDINMFMSYGLQILRGIDEKFVYELNRNSVDIDEEFSVGKTDESSFRHNWVIKRAKSMGIGYRRWRRNE